MPIPKLPPIKLPKETEDRELPPVLGYKGCKLFSGTHIRRVGESRPGTITRTGREQCMVKWYHLNGIVQAEITAYLERY